MKEIMNFQRCQGRLFGLSSFPNLSYSTWSSVRFSKLRAEWAAGFAAQILQLAKELQLNSWRYFIAAEGFRKSTTF